MVESGDYAWNSGMFMWRPGVILREIERHMPALFRGLCDIRDGLGTRGLDDVLKETYPALPAESIDYGVMEKADRVVALKADFYWNDIGSWESIRDIHEEDADGNVTVGEHVLVDSRNNTVFSPDKTVGVLGLDDVVVVDGGDAILVCKRERVQEVRRIVEVLTERGKEESI